jgi:hypothetical protein
MKSNSVEEPPYGVGILVVLVGVYIGFAQLMVVSHLFQHKNHVQYNSTDSNLPCVPKEPIWSADRIGMGPFMLDMNECDYDCLVEAITRQNTRMTGKEMESDLWRFTQSAGKDGYMIIINAGHVTVERIDQPIN